MTRRFAPGEVIVIRDIVFGAVVHAIPHIVVSHEEGLLATYLAVGTKYYGDPYSFVGNVE